MGIKVLDDVVNLVWHKYHSFTAKTVRRPVRYLVRWIARQNERVRGKKTKESRGESKDKGGLGETIHFAPARELRLWFHRTYGRLTFRHRR